MSWFLSGKYERLKWVMAGILWTLRICSGQLLVSKIHSNFNWRNKIPEKSIVLLISIFVDGRNVAPPSMSHDSAQKLLSDRFHSTCQCHFALPYYPVESPQWEGLGSWMKSQRYGPFANPGGQPCHCSHVLSKGVKGSFYGVKSSQTQTRLWDQTYTDSWSTTLTSIWATKFGPLQRK